MHIVDDAVDLRTDPASVLEVKGSQRCMALFAPKDHRPGDLDCLKMTAVVIFAKGLQVAVLSLGCYGIASSEGD